MNEPLISSVDLAAELGDISVRTLQTWRYLGRGPAYVMVGRHVRYRRCDVDAWLDAQTIQTHHNGTKS